MSKKILVVDDEPAIGRLVKLQLSFEGYTARIATNGFEALEAVASWQPELVVLDVMMPCMSGLEVCEKIKHNPKTKQTKVIFLSARGTPEDIKEAKDSGGDDYLIKPFNPDELLGKIEEILGPARV